MKTEALFLFVTLFAVPMLSFGIEPVATDYGEHMPAMLAMLSPAEKRALVESEFCDTRPSAKPVSSAVASANAKADADQWIKVDGVVVKNFEPAKIATRRQIDVPLEKEKEDAFNQWAMDHVGEGVPRDDARQAFLVGASYVRATSSGDERVRTQQGYDAVYRAYKTARMDYEEALHDRDVSSRMPGVRQIELDRTRDVIEKRRTALLDAEIEWKNAKWNSYRSVQTESTTTSSSGESQHTSTSIKALKDSEP